MINTLIISILNVLYWLLLAWPTDRWSVWIGFAIGQVVGMVFPHLEKFVSAQLASADSQMPESDQLPPARSDQIVHSVVFIAAYVVLTIFALTSSDIAFGRGFVIGLGLYYLVHLVADVIEPEKFRHKYLWQLSSYWTQTQIQLLVGVYGGVWMLITIMSLM